MIYSHQYDEIRAQMQRSLSDLVNTRVNLSALNKKHLDVLQWYPLGDCGTFGFGVIEVNDAHRKALAQIVKSEEMILGGTIWYYEGQELVHVGKVQDDGFVISQWGDICIARHKIWKVPTEYGNLALFSPRVRNL